MTIFYLDLECDDLKGTTLLQISCISENNKIFNGFCEIHHILPPRCSRLTGFFTYKGRLFQHGTELDTSPKKQILQAFSDWIVNNSKGQIYLVAHNGFGYDYRVLVKHYLECGLQLNKDIFFCDSLSTFKKFYKNSEPNLSCSLAALSKHFNITNHIEHNGLSDSITLKRVCEQVIRNNTLAEDFFTQTFKTYNQIDKNGSSNSDE